MQVLLYHLLAFWKIEQQKIFREFHISTPKLRNIWIHVEIGIKAGCVQFYKL
jgi:hypothetical protein